MLPRILTLPLAAPVALCLTLALPVAMTTAQPALAEDHEAGTISVTGEGRAEAAPDLATVTLGVTTEGESAAAAMAANTSALNAVMQRLTDAGIEARDIQTSNLSLNPNWQPTEDGTASRIVGYIASNMVTVRVREMEKVGPVLDAVVADGANTLNGISFGFQDEKPLLDRARTDAVQDARARAQLLANAAGVTLGRVLSITEGGAYAPPAPMYRMEAAADAASVPVSGGEVALVASVTMVYEIAE